MRERTRKGFSFTLLTLTAVMSIVTLISIESQYSYTRETPTAIRSTMMYNIVNDLTSDLERSSYIATKRAILSLVDYSVINGTFINDSSESIFLASTDGEYNYTRLPLMENTTIMDWTKSVEYILSRMGINSSIYMLTYNLTQTGMFEVSLNISYDMELVDPQSKMSVRKNISLFIPVDYVTFEDPLNTVYTNRVYGPYIFSTNMVLCNQSAGYIKELTGTATSTEWTTGRIFKSYDHDGILPLSTEERSTKILITHNMSQFSPGELDDFKGIISETSESTGGSSPRISGATNAYTSSTDNALAAMSEEEDRWIRNILTSDGNTCFIAHEQAPTFFDRMEGTLTRGKYNGPGITAFIDIRVLPAKPGEELDFIYWSS